MRTNATKGSKNLVCVNLVPSFLYRTLIRYQSETKESAIGDLLKSHATLYPRKPRSSPKKNRPCLHPKRTPRLWACPRPRPRHPHITLDRLTNRLQPQIPAMGPLLQVQQKGNSLICMMGWILSGEPTYLLSQLRCSPCLLRILAELIQEMG